MDLQLPMVVTILSMRYLEIGITNKGTGFMAQNGDNRDSSLFAFNDSSYSTILYSHDQKADVTCDDQESFVKRR